jgi:hypothetical protein
MRLSVKLKIAWMVILGLLVVLPSVADNGGAEGCDEGRCIDRCARDAAPMICNDGACVYDSNAPVGWYCQCYACSMPDPDMTL